MQISELELLHPQLQEAAELFATVQGMHGDYPRFFCRNLAQTYPAAVLTLALIEAIQRDERHAVEILADALDERVGGIAAFAETLVREHMAAIGEEEAS